eukprot:5908579-Ditylum_brightwellii.AAC.1
MDDDRKEGDEDKKGSGSTQSGVRDDDIRMQRKKNSAKVPRLNLPLAPPSNALAKTDKVDEGNVNAQRCTTRANSAPNLCDMKMGSSGDVVQDNQGNRQRSTSMHSDSQRTLLRTVESLDQLECDARSLIENETFFAVPARRRSTSGHSDGSRGIQGLWQQLDATHSIKLFGSDVVDMDDVSSSRVLPPPPPKRAEPSPKEHLIE